MWINTFYFLNQLAFQPQLLFTAEGRYSTFNSHETAFRLHNAQSPVTKPLQAFHEAAKTSLRRTQAPQKSRSSVDGVSITDTLLYLSPARAQPPHKRFMHTLIPIHGQPWGHSYASSPQTPSSHRRAAPQVGKGQGCRFKGHGVAGLV